jgi:hypothetical protein
MGGSMKYSVCAFVSNLAMPMDVANAAAAANPAALVP